MNRKMMRILNSKELGFGLKDRSKEQTHVVRTVRYQMPGQADPLIVERKTTHNPTRMARTQVKRKWYAMSRKERAATRASSEQERQQRMLGNDPAYD